MAKSKSFFGLRTGSTKTLTFQVLNGQQITKDRVSNVKNPRTRAQMIQRMCMATSSAAYARMKNIVDHSFEGVTYGQMSMSEFIKLNTKLLRDDFSKTTHEFAFNEYQDRLLWPGKYIMAQGSLPAKNAPSFSLATEADKSVIVSIQPPVAHDQYTANTFLSDYGLSVGDMLTALLMIPRRAAIGWDFVYIRFKFVQAGDVALTTANLSQYIVVECSHNLTVAVDGGEITATTTNTNWLASSPICGCKVYSHKSADGWLRSNATMQLGDDIVLDPTADESLYTYPIGADYILNGGEIE